MNIGDVRAHYLKNQKEIEDRLAKFEALQDADDQRWFKELVFVILTSRSSAKNAWEATEKLDELNLLLEGSTEEIADVLEKHEISYERNKADYIARNREDLSQPTLTNPEKELKLKEKLDLDNLEKTRSWLVDNMNGLSWKGASHFLRNVGHGNGFGIVSQHILTRMKALDTIKSVEPPSSEDEYKNVEDKMQRLAREINVDVKVLDLVLWSMETGEVFK